MQSFPQHERQKHDYQQEHQQQIPPQHNSSHPAREPSTSYANYQPGTQSVAAFPEQRFVNKNNPSYYQRLDQTSYREPPKSATVPYRRDWPGLEGVRDRGTNPDRAYHSHQNQYNSPLSGHPQTPTQRAQDKLDRLAEEASSVVDEVSREPTPLSGGNSVGSSFNTFGPRTSSIVPGTPGLILQAPQSRSFPRVTVPEYTRPSESSSPASAVSISSQIAKALPRSSSIDSAMSETSAQARSQSSNGTGATVQSTSPQHIAELINAAGSPEEAIKALLKEKASSQAQNTQLWRLVDKQRAMILGLNKDLERALKEKERYRNKFKDHVAQFPSLQNELRSNAESPVPSEAADGQSPHESIDPEMNGILRSDSIPSLIEQDRQSSVDGQQSSFEERGSIHTTSSHLTNAGVGPTGAGGSTESYNSSSFSTPKREIHAIAPPLNYRMSKMEQLGLSVDTQHQKASGFLKGNLSPNTQGALSAAVTPISATTPLSATSVGSERMSMRKKAPPARLELSPTQPMPFSATRGKDNDEPNNVNDDDDDDDDDDDRISVDEIPGYELQQRQRNGYEVPGEENESRRKSSTQSVPETIITEPHDSTETDKSVTVEKVGLSGRRPVPQQLTKLRETEVPGVSSHRSTPGTSGDNIVSRTVMITGPLSPGLPSSPRPSPNSPLPRPRRNVASPEPLSPRSFPQTPRMGLPSSPRVGLMPGPFQGMPVTPSKDTFGPTGLGLVPLSPSPFATEFSSNHGSVQHGRQNSLAAAISSPKLDLQIDPSEITSIIPRVVSSRMRPSRASFLPGRKSGHDDSVFTLGIFSRSTDRELWRVEKDVGSLSTLDNLLRQHVKDFAPQLPERSLFNGHAPARVDARRAAIDEYFAGVMALQMDNITSRALSEWFSADIVDGSLEPPMTARIKDKDGFGNSERLPNNTELTKEGYLTKKGKNFGGWKARYFSLDSTVLRYFESPGGPHLGSIKLLGAQIGRQSQKEKESKEGNNDEEAENQFRHAFLILEPKKRDSGSLVKHVLCAESDAERDEWVAALMKWVEKANEEAKSEKAEQSKNHKEEKKRRDKEKDKKDDKEAVEENLKSFSYEDVSAGSLPTQGPSPAEPGRYRSPTPTSVSNQSTPSLSAPAPFHQPISSPNPERGPSKAISAPKNGTVISDLSAWGNQSDKAKEKALKKRSIWGFRGRSSSDLGNEHRIAQAVDPNKIPAGKMVFGVSLQEAISVSRPAGMDVALPAVVYRCLEYLDAKNAVNEEGIFRLSGSNAVIKALRDRFNSEVDVNLLAHEEYYDVHAVAGLLKLYLRELPTTILTSERREDFMRVTELDNQDKKVACLRELVNTLPIENYTLLKALSGHLIRVVDNAHVNKMTVRNVGIVFSPTLNIPPQVFALFLQDHYDIFQTERPPAQERRVQEVNIPHQHQSSQSHTYNPHNQQPQQHQQQQQQPQRMERVGETAQTQPLRANPPPSFTDRIKMEPPKTATFPLASSGFPSAYRPHGGPHAERPDSKGDSTITSPGMQRRASYVGPDSAKPFYLQGASAQQQQLQEQLQRQQNPLQAQLEAATEQKNAKARRRESSMLSSIGMRDRFIPPPTPQGTFGMVLEDDLY